MGGAYWEELVTIFLGEETRGKGVSRLLALTREKRSRNSKNIIDSEKCMGYRHGQ